MYAWRMAASACIRICADGSKLNCSAEFCEDICKEINVNLMVISYKALGISE
jgi:hypothetical protein